MNRPSNSPHKNLLFTNSQCSKQQISPQRPFSSNPFELLNKQINHTITDNNQYTRNHIPTGFEFKTYDFSNNPMIQSRQQDFPQMIESQMINKNKVNKSQFFSPFLNQYETQQFVQKHLNENTLENQAQNDVYQQYHEQQNEEKYNNLFEGANIVQDTHYDNLVIHQPQIHQQINISSPNKQTNSHHETKELQNFSKQSNNLLKGYKNQLKTNRINYSPNKSSVKKISQNEHSLSQDISQVKSRLDQLMSKFPIQNLNTAKKQTKFKKKNIPLQFSAPQLQIRRTKSIDEENSFQFRTKNQQINNRNPHTQVKILIQEQSLIPSINGQNSQLYPRNTQSKQKYSLNYSQSGNGSKKQIILPNPHIQSLYHQIHQQQEAISTYKQIIYRLQNENMHLVGIIQNQFQQRNQNIKNYQLNNAQSSNNNTHTHQILFNGIDLSNKSQFQDQFNSIRKNSHLSDQFHKFQRQQSVGSKNNQSQRQNLQIQSSHKPPKIRTSGKIRLSLQQQVQILESQKSDLLSKIDWLNGVIQQMMNMGQKMKSQKSVILDNVSSQYKKSKHSRQQSKEIGKNSQVIQTSFVESHNNAELEKINYKNLYEKQIAYQNHMKSEIKQLSQLQDAYGQQFEMILKEINEIKKNREYYQQLKKQIKKSKEKSLKKKDNYNNQKNPSIKYISTNPTKVFENKLIYQLKDQNQHLLSKYLKLKQLYLKQKVSKNNINSSKNQLNLSNKSLYGQESVDISVVQSKHQNPFAQRNIQKRNQILQRQFKDQQHYQRNQNKNKKRPSSYCNFDIPKSNVSTQSRMKMFQKRKNGSIYCLSQVQDITMSRGKNNLTNPIQLQSFYLDQKRNLSLNSAREKYSGRVAKKSYGQDFASQVIETSLVNKIVEQDKERSSNYTHETSENMINRYNNFIKNMKKRFGINSSIIGREVQAANEYEQIYK